MIKREKIKALILVWISSLLVVLSGCNQFADTGESDHFTFQTKEAHRLSDNGWIYYCYATYNGDSLDDNNGILYYYYGACNIENRNIEGYNDIPILDETTKEIIGYAESQMPNLIYGNHEREELIALNDYLNDKQFSESISIEDLEDFHFKELDEKLFITLFNEMIDNSALDDQGFCNWPENGMIQDAVLDGYQWQIGYYVSHGTLIGLHIVPVVYYENEAVNLTKLDNRTGNDEKLLIFLKNAEDSILKNQSFTGVDFSGTIGKYDLTRLERLLETLPKVH